MFVDEIFIPSSSIKEYFQVEPFVCPWYVSMEYAHSQDDIDRLWNDLMNPMELSESNFPLYINRFHYLNATKRFEQGKAYLETLIDAFPYSIELWTELLSNIEQTDVISEVRNSQLRSLVILEIFRPSTARENPLESIMNLFIPW